MGRNKEIQQHTQAIASLEEQLEDIPFDSPDYKVIQDQICRTKKQRASAMNSPCPVVKQWVSNDKQRRNFKEHGDVQFQVIKTFTEAKNCWRSNANPL